MRGGPAICKEKAIFFSFLKTLEAKKKNRWKRFLRKK